MAPAALSTMGEADVRLLMSELGEATWRADQLREAVWRSSASSLADVVQLPARLRELLVSRVHFTTVSVVERRWADGGSTLTLVCELEGRQRVETVIMESPARRSSKRRTTVCVSSQVGCAIGCPFCATGQLGLTRNCTAAEIVDQVRAAQSAVGDQLSGPITHVVFMGMGEPLANFRETAGAIQILTTAGGISARRITVSTSGVVPGIERLTDLGVPVTLAISLHASTDPLRDRLVPLNRTFPIERVVDAAMRYAAATRRRLTFEWCLIAGVNDSAEQAGGLRALALRAGAHINVIPMNPVPGSPWRAPGARRTAAFLSLLAGARVTVREQRAGEVGGACGQLQAGLERRRLPLPGGGLSELGRRIDH